MRIRIRDQLGWCARSSRWPAAASAWEPPAPAPRPRPPGVARNVTRLSTSAAVRCGNADMRPFPVARIARIAAASNARCARHDVVAPDRPPRTRALASRRRRDDPRRGTADNVADTPAAQAHPGGAPPPRASRLDEGAGGCRGCRARRCTRRRCRAPHARPRRASRHCSSGTCTVSFRLIGVKMPLLSAASRRAGMSRLPREADPG